MAYTASSFVFGEQPSASKWNLLWANDASFADGTGIATNAITGAKLATSAIKLGYAEITTTFTTTTASAYIDVTSLATTVTVPAGGRDVEIEVFAGGIKTSAIAGTALTLAIMESTTTLGTTIINEPVSAFNVTGYCKARVSAPSAASHTYKAVVAQSAAGTITVAAGTANPAFGAYGPAFILVKLI